MRYYTMKKRIIKITAIIFLKLAVFCFAAESVNNEFCGVVNKENINVRADANTNSPIICQLSKNSIVEVVYEKYDWYKIKLPKKAACYVKKELIEAIDNKTAKIAGENVNIRLAPNESSPIIGKLSANEIVAILSDKGQWYEIKATDNSFGWMHKKFITKSSTEPPIADKLSASLSEGNSLNENIILEGVIEPYGKVINRAATHKLITKDYDIYLLKGTPANLNALTYHKVRITGKAIPSSKQKYPVIEIAKMEALD